MLRKKYRERTLTYIVRGKITDKNKKFSTEKCNVLPRIIKRAAIERVEQVLRSITVN